VPGVGTRVPPVQGQGSNWFWAGRHCPPVITVVVTGLPFCEGQYKDKPGLQIPRGFMTALHRRPSQSSCKQLLVSVPMHHSPHSNPWHTIILAAKINTATVPTICRIPPSFFIFMIFLCFSCRSQSSETENSSWPATVSKGSMAETIRPPLEPRKHCGNSCIWRQHTLR